MNRTIRRMTLLISASLLVTMGTLQAQTKGYKSPEEIGNWIQELVASHPGHASYKVLTRTPGGRPVYLLEIGNETGSAE